MTAGRRARRGALLAAATMLGATGCGAGSPLLHPARTLSGGEVRGAIGFGQHVALGDAATRLREARERATRDPGLPGVPGTQPDYAAGALAAASVAPGPSPFVAARVGLGGAFEAGLAYTGRGARLDARRSFDLSPSTSISVGLGGTGIFYGRSEGSALPGVDLKALRGYGADVPLLVGWESDAGVYKGWLGARGGFERARIETLTTEGSQKASPLLPPAITLEGTRFFAGGLVGLAAGFRRVHVAMELEVAYQTARGTFNGTRASVSGLTATPSTALLVRF